MAEKRINPTNVNDRLLLALNELDFENYEDYIWTHIDIIQTAGKPRITRSSARKGLKELRKTGYARHSYAFVREEALLGGSGHSITKEGIEYLKQKGII